MRLLALIEARIALWIARKAVRHLERCTRRATLGA
jgi:hypothetical protein